MIKIKSSARRLLGDTIVGMIDYFRFPNLGADVSDPFNGQHARQGLFREIVAKLQPAAIVETGTYLGTTTNFMAQTGLPVFTIELDPRRCGYVRARFRRSQNVTVIPGDSRTGLCSLLRGPLRDLTTSTLFFYLDAHWNDDLPLAEEIGILFSLCRSAVVMIDDFQVPFDPGYGYDDYGDGRSLTFAYIGPAITAHRLRGFYPSTQSADEGGWRRGCIVLVKREHHEEILSSIPLLRRSPDENLACAGLNTARKRCVTLAEVPVPPTPLGKTGCPGSR